MNHDQIAIIAILAAAMAAFAANRWRPELIALVALAAAAMIGLVSPASIFGGFSDPAVITVVEILMLAQLLARSGLVDRFARPVLARIKTERQLLIFLIATGAALSVFMNNIGALAIMLPVAYSGCRLLSISPRQVLMPLSFATLLGGMCSLIGTPANLVVSAARNESIGMPMDFFAYAIIGVPAAALGVIWLWATHSGQRKSADENEQPKGAEPSAPADSILFETLLSETSGWAGRLVGEVEEAENVAILNLVRDGKFVFERRETMKLFEGDIVIALGGHALFDRLLDAGEVDAQSGETTPVYEAAVSPSSVLVGSSVGELLALSAHDVRVVGLRGGHLRADGRLDDVKLSVGDVILIVGERGSVEAAIEESGCMALAGRRKSAPGALTPVAALALLAGVVLSAFQIAPPEIAFGAALLVTAVAGVAALPDLVRRINWRVVIMLAALIPVASAFESTGAAVEIARPLFAIAQTNEIFLIGSVWAICVLITPFLNNVAAAAIVAPVAIGASQISGVSADALLLAVAAGASTDFLTPFGHHNNTIVMGAAGYDLKDFLKKGAPLTLIVGAVTVLALAIAF